MSVFKWLGHCLTPCRQWVHSPPDSPHRTITTQSTAAQKFVTVSEWQWRHWRSCSRPGTVSNTSILTKPKAYFQWLWA